MSEVDATSGAPDLSTSGDNQGQSVSFETFNKVLKEKKNIIAKYADVDTKLARLAELEQKETQLERQRLEQAGQYKDVLSKFELDLQAERDSRKQDRSKFAKKILDGELKSLAQGLGAKSDALDALVTLAYNQGLKEVPAISDDFEVDKDALNTFLSNFQTKNSFLFTACITPQKNLVPNAKPVNGPEKSLDDMSRAELEELAKRL